MYILPSFMTAAAAAAATAGGAAESKEGEATELPPFRRGLSAEKEKKEEEKETDLQRVRAFVQRHRWVGREGGRRGRGREGAPSIKDA